jgi:hypothetical protein
MITNFAFQTGPKKADQHDLEGLDIASTGASRKTQCTL